VDRGGDVAGSWTHTIAGSNLEFAAANAFIMANNGCVVGKLKPNMRHIAHKAGVGRKRASNYVAVQAGLKLNYFDMLQTDARGI